MKTVERSGGSYRPGTGKTPVKRFNFPRKERDPNAMDIDFMGTDERTRLMKEGRCFKCKKTGHMGKDCPTNERKNEEKKKMDGKMMYAHVRSLMKELDEDEKEEFMKEAEDAGF